MSTKQETAIQLPKEQLRAVEFEGQNVIYAKDQPDYLPLPAYVDTESREAPALFCFAVNDYQKERIQRSGKLWVRCLTFGHPLQPIALMVPEPIPEDPDPITETMIQGRDEIKAEDPAAAKSNKDDRKAYEERHKTYLAEEIGRQMMDAGLIDFTTEEIPERPEVRRLIATVTIKHKPTN